VKIICIGRNYLEHARELNNPPPEAPIFFLKHEGCLVRHNRPFFLPDFSDNIHYELELVVRINHLGKKIEKRFGHRYYDEIGLGIDFTARDLQQKAREQGLPWEISKAFDNAAPVSQLLPLEKSADIQDLHFYLDLNGRTVQKGHTKDMIFSIDELISHVSQYMTLKTGDLIFTGTPEGVGPVKIDDHLEAYLEGQKMLDFFVR
jgi:2-keto-4-pentenoate hydratase/2-oxohepta-3-ene-1,7-dioic acid hydratase in catechol pathway